MQAASDNYEQKNSELVKYAMKQGIIAAALVYTCIN